MKKIFIFTVFLLAVGMFFGCSSVVDNAGQGRLEITAFDAPAPDSIDHIYIDVIEVSIHNEDDGWIVLSEPDTTIDFLDLINGVTVVLGDDSLPSGEYSQLRLLLSDTNTIVIAGVEYPLTVPSGMQTGVKLNFDFTLSPDEFVKLYVDFDLSKAVVTASDMYILHPTFKVFKEDLSGTISGIVTDTLGSALENVVVNASSALYSTSTFTDSFGSYMLILPMGMYDISPTIDTTQSVDTTYTDVELNAGDNLTGFDFVIE